MSTTHNVMTRVSVTTLVCQRARARRRDTLSCGRVVQVGGSRDPRNLRSRVLLLPRWAAGDKPTGARASRMQPYSQVVCLIVNQVCVRLCVCVCEYARARTGQNELFCLTATASVVCQDVQRLGLDTQDRQKKKHLKMTSCAAGREVARAAVRAHQAPGRACGRW